MADGDEVVVLLVGDQSNYHHDLQGADMDAFLNGTLCVLWLNRAFRDVMTLILDTRLLQFKLCFESATELLNLKQTELYTSTKPNNGKMFVFIANLMKWFTKNRIGI